MIRRREFITLLGGAALMLPLAAWGQQPGKLPTIAVLGSPSAPAWAPLTAAFAQRLRDLGWIDGRSVAIEYRWAEGRGERAADIAAEFVRLKVDVIVTAGSMVPALKQATSSIPIVFALSADPLGSGLVASLARPGGNCGDHSRMSVARLHVPGVLPDWRDRPAPGRSPSRRLHFEPDPGTVLPQLSAKSAIRQAYPAQEPLGAICPLTEPC